MKNIARSYGTFPLRGDELSTALSHAINTSYRAIDTAKCIEMNLKQARALPPVEFLPKASVSPRKCHLIISARQRFFPPLSNRKETCRCSKFEIAEIDQLTKTGYRVVDKSAVPWAPDRDR